MYVDKHCEIYDQSMKIVELVCMKASTVRYMISDEDCGKCMYASTVRYMISR